MKPKDLIVYGHLLLLAEFLERLKEAEHFSWHVLLDETAGTDWLSCTWEAEKLLFLKSCLCAEYGLVLGWKTLNSLQSIENNSHEWKEQGDMFWWCLVSGWMLGGHYILSSKLMAIGLSGVYALPWFLAEGLPGKYSGHYQYYLSPPPLYFTSHNGLS